MSVLKSKFKAGQTVFIRLTGNACRGKTGRELIQEWIIEKVGTKYIYASNKSGYQKNVCFEKRDYGFDVRFVQKTDYCVDYILYESRKEIEDELYSERLYRDISYYFRNFSKCQLSIEQLEKIKSIIDE